jgi:hypothetical protein
MSRTVLASIARRLEAVRWRRQPSDGTREIRAGLSGAVAAMSGSQAVRWALFAVTTALVLAALPGAALARTVDGGWQPIGVQTCGTPAPTCDAVYSRTVTTAGLLRARYRAPADHVGPVRITFIVDGVAVATSDWVRPGEWAGPFQLGPVSAGQHELTLRTEGQIDVTSWAGDLELWTNDTEAPLQWNAGDDFMSGDPPANPGPDALGHGGVWGYDGSPSLVRDPGTYTRLATFRHEWTSAHLRAWHGTELDEGSGIPLPGAAATATGPRQFASGALAPHELLLHPFTSRLAVLDWRSPVNAVVAVTGGLRDSDAFCGDGIGWQLHLDGTKLAEGILANGAQAPYPAIDPVTVTAGDHLRLSIDPGAADDRFCDSTAVDLTIRTVDRAAGAAVTVSGTANIWAAHADPLSGYGLGGDLGTAPVRLELTGGAVTFPAVTGWISCLHTEIGNWDGPDGPCGKGSEQHVSAAGGISAYGDSTGNFPLVGVFLAGSQPLAPPDALDVSGAEVTAEIAPALGQVFRIGDGRTASGALQSFVPPPGAAGLFLAVPDAPSFVGSPGSYADDAGTLDVSVSGARASATLRVIKQVVNDDGGSALASDWTMHIRSGLPLDDVVGKSPFAGAESPGVTRTLAAGSYVVSESGGPAGYASTFSADCNASGQITLAPGESKTCTITNDDIAPTQRRLTVVIFGSGTVTLPPDGPVCSTTCNKEYADGDVITITAEPAPGWRFKEWSGGGACSGQVPACEIRMDDAKSVTATFEKLAHALTVSRDGTGAGHVSSVPAGIDCASDCAQEYEHGTEVTLTATPAAGSSFAGWSDGACIGTGACKVSMTQARSVVATFATGRHALTVVKEGTGSGTITSAPAGIDCGSDCAQTYDHDAMVTLTAQADIGSSFFGWTGVPCVNSGGDSCAVPMTQARTVKATFHLTKRSLQVVKLRDGSGTVTSTPDGIDCGPTCAHDFPTRSTVTLTATADPGSRFTGWLAEDCPDTGDCTVTLDVPKTVGARFEPVASHYNLNVLRDGDGRGTVTSAPAGIDCGIDCSQSYADGTEVTLTAAPNAGSTFIGWHGACTGTATCTVSMGAPREVWATFGRATEPGVWSLAHDFRTNFDGTPSNPAPDSRRKPDVWSFLYSDGSPNLDTVREPDAYHVLSEHLSDPLLGWREPGLDFVEAWMADQPGTHWPPHAVMLHPSVDRLAVVAWTSPVNGHVQVTGGLTDEDPSGGNGVRWFVSKNAADLASGAIGNGSCATHAFHAGAGGASLRAIPVGAGDVLYFAVDPRGPDGDADLTSDTTALDVTIREVPAGAPPPNTGIWSLQEDMRRAPIQQNPNFDAYGNLCAWSFEQGDGVDHDDPSSPLSGLTQGYAGQPGLEAWTGSETMPTWNLPAPTVGLNAGTEPKTAATGTWPVGKIVVQPSATRTARVHWRAPFTGHVRISGGVQDLDANGGDGVLWFVDRGSTTLASGAVHDGAQAFAEGLGGGALGAVDVALGDVVSVVIAPGVTDAHDTTGLDLVIEQVATPKHNLTVLKDGAGSGRVGSVPGGIDCGPDCTESYDDGSSVTLTATAAEGSRFAGWSGDGGGCGETLDCTVTTDRSRDVVARFEKVRRILDVSKPGNGVGTVTSAPAGISCGSTCAAGFDDATEVTLTAVAAAGSRFTGWSGADCSGTGACKVTMDASKSVQARFERNVARRILAVLKITDGFAKAGTVRADPAGDRNFDCGFRCTTGYDDGTHVSLTVVKPLPPGTRFAGWSGDCKGTALTCALEMNAGKLVTARFVLTDPKPRIGRAGTAKAVHGTVLVQRPGTAATARASTLQEPPPAPPAFVPLDALEAIPVGSIVDVTHGTVELTVTNAKGKTEKVRATGGLFKFTQGRRGRSKGVATLALTGASFDACGKSKRSIRKLSVSGAGTAFRVRGRASEGTSRRGRWTTDDRCDGTVTKVRQGVVSVRDLARRATVTVRKGRSHTVRAKRRR